jgi:hypothetical protein
MGVFCSFAPGAGFKKEQEALFEKSAQKLLYIKVSKR